MKYIYSYPDCNSNKECKEYCECPIQLYPNCILFNKIDLKKLKIQNGDDLVSVIKNIDNNFIDIYSKIDKGHPMNSLGVGVDVYKGLNSEGVREFRSIKGFGSLEVKEKDEEIEISYNDTSIIEKIEALELKISKINNEGLTDDNLIIIGANEDYEYIVPDDCILFAFDIIAGSGNINVGSVINNSDLAQMNYNPKDIIQLGLINNQRVWINSDSDIRIIPIVYRRVRGTSASF